MLIDEHLVVVVFLIKLLVFGRWVRLVEDLLALDVSGATLEPLLAEQVNTGATVRLGDFLDDLFDMLAVYFVFILDLILFLVKVETKIIATVVRGLLLLHLLGDWLGLTLLLIVVVQDLHRLAVRGEALLQLININLKDIKVVLIVLQPLEDVLSVCAVSLPRVRIRVLLAIAGHVALVEFHDLLV